MDDKGTIAEAVSVNGLGHIVKVGTEKDVTAGLGSGVEIVRLKPEQVLMPGFIDPHMHLLPTLTQSILGKNNLAPCLPPPYRGAATDCETRADLLGALASMQVPPPAKGQSHEFVLGMNLDPSRQQFIPGGCGAGGPDSFMKKPKFFLDACVSKDRPVLILDQSGHLAYVNQKAFAAICSTPEKCDALAASAKSQGGTWVKDEDGYTGLLQETAAFAPFLAAMEKSLPLGLAHQNPLQLFETYEKEIQQTLQEIRAAGLTTLADGGLSGVSQIQLDKVLAERQDFSLRITGVVTYDTALKENLQPTGPSCDPSKDPGCKLPKWLGAGGIKLWVDGSTQGCTAKLAEPYQYLSSGHCPTSGHGQTDFKDAKAIADKLSSLWETSSWRVQMHANGNEANRWALDAFAQLQLQKPNPRRALLIHNTVGEQAVSQDIGKMRKGTFAWDKKPVPALDVRVTHLIGHVAYWGDAFTEMLGADAAKNIDPVLFDRQNEIPFSFHSDSMVTPLRPLWFVEQAVTRRTWAYPEFTKSYELGPEHKATVEEALRAVTVEPARQHELDAWLGSIEPGKVADFVLLGANPLDYDPAKGGDPTQISKIAVIETFLNGKPTGVSH
ncbi:amidohydrolase family protein [Corallococcus sp. bb12-1]|nr:amidohydrolase family protein [Corallococcus sp. bb12-1]